MQNSFEVSRDESGSATKVRKKIKGILLKLSSSYWFKRNNFLILFI